MKKLVLLTLLSGVSLFGRTYLGGAYNLSHCSQIAGAYGYPLAVFGAGFDDRGIYYPYFNACFGDQNGGVTPPPTQSSSYDVYVRSGFDMNRCADDISWELPETRCRIQGSYLQCRSNRPLKKERIERVACVDRAYSVNR